MSRTTRLAALAAALLVAPAARAQPRPGPMPEQIAIPGGGTEVLRALLDRDGVRPVTENELRNMWVGTDDLIVVVIGSPHQWGRPVDPLHWARLAVAANGAALIATDDRATLRESSWNNQQVGDINGGDVTAGVADCYGGLAECPFAVPVSPDEFLKAGVKPGPVWSVFRGLNKIATNQPSYIEMRRYLGEYQYPVARLPKSSQQQWGGRFRLAPLLAVGGDGPEQLNGGPGYSFLAVADSSIFINQMVMEPGTDNFRFAERAVEYLRGPGGHRKRCAFFENGRLVESFDELKRAIAKPKPKIPPEAVPNLGPLFGKNQDKLVDMVDKLADQAQTKDALHNWKVGKEGSQEERRSFARWVEGAAAALAVCASLFLLGRTLRARHPTNLPPPPGTGAGAASTGPPGVFDRRQKELVRRNNLYEPVRNLLREFFESAGAPPRPGPRLPRLVIDHRRVRKPESLRQALRDAWRIAYGPPAYVSAQRWFELEPYFERLRQAHDDGKWRFATEEA